MADRSARGRAEREARRRSQAYTVRQAVHRERGERRRRDDRVAVAVFVPVLSVAILAQVLYFTTGPGTPRPAPVPSASLSASGSPSASASPSSSRSASASASPSASRSPSPSASR